MTKKKIWALLVIVLATIVFARAFYCNKFENYKTQVIRQLSQYYERHRKYPKNLSQIPVGEKFGFFYLTNNERNYYSIEYNTGIIGCNSNEYNSKDKIWVVRFNY